MYDVSAAFIVTSDKASRTEHVRGTIGSVSFDDSNIISLSYSNQASGTSDVTLGSAYVGQLEVSFVGLPIPRGDWRALVISLEFGFEVASGDTEWIPIGVFTVASAEWSNTAINIVANDNMAKFDKAFGITSTSGTIYDFLALACETCNISLGMTPIQIAALPNGTEIFGLYPNSDIKTWRDFISWVAQLCGGFATINRSGALVIKTFGPGEAVAELTAGRRIVGSSFSDYETEYDGISIVNIEDKTTSYYSGGTGNGAVINLGSNPFLQYGTDEVRTRQRMAIASAVHEIAYTPCSFAVLNNPAYDLGDVITCSGGVAGTEATTCVMAVDWTFKQSIAISCYGADPSLSSGKSKTDKALSGLLSKTSENEVITHTFVNAQELVLGEDMEVQVLRIRFATVSPRVVTLFHEIDLDTQATSEDGIITCQAKYYLNGDLISYSPITTWDNDGMHLLHLMYFLNTLESGARYDWEVRLIISGGTATIERDNVHAILQGQGLVAVETWDGLLEIEDEYSLTLGGNMALNYTDDAAIAFITPLLLPEITDNYSLTVNGNMSIAYTDDINIVMHEPIFNIVTEDDEPDNWITEEDEYSTIITEGGEVDNG